MKLIRQTPKQTLNKAFLKLRPLRSEIDLFKNNLIRLIKNVDEIEREENQKNHVRDFLRDTYYKDLYEINTKDNKDLVIHLGKTNKDKVGVIIEAKRPSNKSEMLTPEKPNVKAFHELVLYYLRERIEENNTDIKYCIATNIYEWYIIEASYFEKLFFRNNSLVREYQKWRDKLKVTSDTKLFYGSIVKPFIDQIEHDIPCVYFDIRSYKKILFDTDLENDKNLNALYKVLSPFHLLRVPFSDDNNKLNEGFYRELLYIIGLEEKKEKGKIIITRKEEKRNSASLLELAYEELQTVGLHKIPILKNFGDNLEEQLFNISLELSITWINRILFLKLLEGQLYNYHNGNRDYLFLNSDRIGDFDELFKLFHKVLAIRHEDRTEAIKEKHSLIPYLNSSLFEISELEDQTITINSLDNTSYLEMISTTILIETKRKNIKLTTLQYLFKFLDSFDFSSNGTDDILEDVSKTLINASVLGKVFEKINGYKDGSVFTPGYITMYMCKQSIRLSVIQKFKDKFGWSIGHFNDLKNYISDYKTSDEILKLNEVINSLRLCDPAVGSGHFLVSSLNEIIAIKSELGLLADEKGIRFNNCEITIENDELLVTNTNGDIFEYKIINGKPQNKELQRLQKTLFHEKQTIIENCLFGVDINPNSVKICRLRLWIELLKNAYYKEDKYSELETLPNIDINIKCGNSLLNRFSVNDKLDDVLKKKQFNVKTYKAAVNSYRNSTEKKQKHELLDLIDKIKKEYSQTIYSTDPRRKKISDLRGQLTLLQNNYDLFGKRISDEEKEWEEKRLSILIEQRVKELEAAESGKIYYHAFEWRFEFPEVLNDNGEYEGFDIIIGNPPYIESRSSAIDEKLKDEILKNINKRRKKDGDLITRGSDILIYFYELGLFLIKKDGYLAFITQNAWLNTDYGFKFQKFLKTNTEVIGVFDNDIKYFDDSANINTIITLFKGKIGNELNKINFVRFNVGFEKAPFEPEEISSISDSGLVIKVQQNDEILNKMKWGIILNSDNLTIDLHKRLYEKSIKLNSFIRIGQGLNLVKDHLVSMNLATDLGLLEKNLIPFFTSDDGAPYSLDRTMNYLINKVGLTKTQIKKIQSRGIIIPTLNRLTRQTPSLILPRGVGRFFCAINNCNAYSSSFVEIYLGKNKNTEKHIKFLWLFLNSSIGWIIREISGRKNLGGGMLKAEASDLKNYPLLYNFDSEYEVINLIFSTASKRQAENCQVELNSHLHQEIDKIVFKKLGYSNAEKKQIVTKLSELINMRVTKSKSKV